jgi:uncharacterized RDD family membrane protein YckC
VTFRTKGHDVKQAFDIHDGTVEVVVDEPSRTVGIYRFDAQHRNLAATMESWDHVDLAEVLTRKIGLSAEDAHHVAGQVRSMNAGMGAAPEPEHFEEIRRLATPFQLDPAGVALRFVAVLLDAVVVLFPLSVIIGIVAGGAYSERAPGYADAGVNVAGNAIWVSLALGIAYYILCEGMTGRTLGKRLVGIRVVDEEGDEIDFSGAVIRNLLRLVDGLFFYLVGALFVFSSPRGQRLGDRAAHTVVVRG